MFLQTTQKGEKMKFDELFQHKMFLFCHHTSARFFLLHDVLINIPYFQGIAICFCVAKINQSVFFFHRDVVQYLKKVGLAIF